MKFLTAVSACLLLFVTMAWAENHPDYSKYEYRVVNNQPLGALPPKGEWGQWDCEDSTHIVIKCSFAMDEDNLAGFSFIYRKRPVEENTSGDSFADMIRQAEPIDLQDAQRKYKQTIEGYKSGL